MIANQNENKFSTDEKIKLGVWSTILLFASLGNMAFYWQITIYNQFIMLLPFIVVVILQFMSLFEIYFIAGNQYGNRRKRIHKKHDREDG